jgi:transposase
VLAVVVTAATVHDRAGAKQVLTRAQDGVPRGRLRWAAAADAGPVVAWVRAACGWVLASVRQPAGSTGWLLLPQRWVVERTLGGFGRYRRLRKDDEGLPTVSEALLPRADSRDAPTPPPATDCINRRQGGGLAR